MSQDLSGLLPWSWAEERLESARNYWICTCRPKSRPHAMPVWGVWLEGGFCFSTGRKTRKARNLAACADLTVHLESGDEVVILEGRAEEVEAAALDPLIRKYRAKYKLDPPLREPGKVTYRLRPTLAFGWREKDFPSSATRWEF